MVLLMTYKTLVNIEAILFVIAGILLVIGAVINANELSRRIGLPTWKEWWEELKKH